MDAFKKYKVDPFAKYKTKEEFADLSSINYYPISFTEFTVRKSVGNYPIFYCVLSDRIHFEMPIENAVFATQKKFIKLPDDEYLTLPERIKMFVRHIVVDKPYVEYKPTPEKQIEYMRLEVD